MLMFRIIKNNIKFYILIICVLTSIIHPIIAQDIPTEIEHYNFVRYDKNKLQLFNDSLAYNHLFNKFNQLIIKGEGHIKILHIGDSHIQADIYTSQIRQRMQTFFQGGIGCRGFIFPYTLAKTNNPLNYKVSYTGNWKSCRNVEKAKKCKLGLSGIRSATSDTNATLTIKINTHTGSETDFNSVKIFHEFGKNQYQISFNKKYIIKNIFEDSILGYTQYNFKNYHTSLSFHLKKTKSEQNKFEFDGISLENNDPGITYHAIGVNGAKAESFLRCSLMQNHIKALDPDWIIISLGTNEAYEDSYNSQEFKQQYTQLLMQIKETQTKCPILLTIPGDSYKLRQYPNKNNSQARQIIFNIAENFDCAIWDFYEIMGGFNSVQLWYDNNLAGNDKLHLTKYGYIFQGNLFFNAFIKKYDSFIEMKQTGTR